MRSQAGLMLVAFACGVCALQMCAALPPWPHVIGIAGVIASMAALRWRAARVAAVLGVFIAGFGYAACRAHARLAEALPVEWEGAVIELVGVVDDLPALSSRGARFAFAVEDV